MRIFIGAGVHISSPNQSSMAWIKLGFYPTGGQVFHTGTLLRLSVKDGRRLSVWKVKPTIKGLMCNTSEIYCGLPPKPWLQPTLIHFQAWNMSFKKHFSQLITQNLAWIRPSLSPQTLLWSCEDQETCPHYPSRSSLCWWNFGSDYVVSTRTHTHVFWILLAKFGICRNN